LTTIAEATPIVCEPRADVELLKWYSSRRGFGSRASTAERVMIDSES